MQARCKLLGSKIRKTTKTFHCRYLIIRSSSSIVIGIAEVLEIAVVCAALGKFYFYLTRCSHSAYTVRVAKQNRSGGRIADITGSRFISLQAIRSGMRTPRVIIYEIRTGFESGLSDDKAATRLSG